MADNNLKSTFRVGLGMTLMGSYWILGGGRFPTVQSTMSKFPFALSVILSRLGSTTSPSSTLPSSSSSFSLLFSVSAALNYLVGPTGTFARDNFPVTSSCVVVATISILSLLDRLLGGRVKRFIYAHARSASLAFFGFLSFFVLRAPLASYGLGSAPLSTLWQAFLGATSLLAVPAILTAPLNAEQQRLLIGKLFCVANAAFAAGAFGVLAGKSRRAGEPACDAVLRGVVGSCVTPAESSVSDLSVERAADLSCVVLSVFFGLVAVRGLELSVGIEILPRLGNLLLSLASFLDRRCSDAIAIIKDVLYRLLAAVSALWRNVAEPLARGVGVIATWIGRAATLVQGHVLNPTGRGIARTAEEVWRAARYLGRKTADGATTVATWIGRAATLVQSHVLNPTGRGIARAAEDVWRATCYLGRKTADGATKVETFMHDRVVAPLWSAMRHVLNKIGNLAKWVFSRLWRHVLAPAGSFLRASLEALARLIYLAARPLFDIIYPAIAAWASIEFAKSASARSADGLVVLPFVLSSLAFGSVALILGAQELELFADSLRRKALRRFGLHSTTVQVARAMSVICKVAEAVGVFVYSHLDLGLIHATTFVVSRVFSAAEVGVRLSGRVLGALSSVLKSVLEGVHFVISSITTALWSLCKSIFAAIATVITTGCSMVWRGITTIWTNPVLSLLASVGALASVYLAHSGRVDLKGFVSQASALANRIFDRLLSPSAAKGAFAFLSEAQSFFAMLVERFVQKNSSSVLPDRAQLEGFYVAAMSAASRIAQAGSNLWQESLAVPSAKQHFQSVGEF